MRKLNKKIDAEGNEEPSKKKLKWGLTLLGDFAQKPGDRYRFSSFIQENKDRFRG